MYHHLQKGEIIGTFFQRGGDDKGRTKHMDIRYHYVRELVQQKHLSITYCPSSQMTADILTKPLDIKTFLCHRSKLLGNLVCGGC